jgi:putative oxygen-independent coproporphyrinogen III oxidase
MSTSLPRVIPIFDERRAQQPFISNRPQGLEALPPLALYVHVPWCVRKCPYCDFNSHELKADVPEADYLEALASDLEQALPQIWGRQVHSVFIGGGTPSLLSAQALDRLLALLRSHLSLWPDAEVTLEANPGTAEAHKFKSYSDSGVNRISLGIQSFNNAHLAALGRIHDSSQARQAVEMALNTVNRVNLDLMYGLPGQTPDEWAHDLRIATGFGSEHLSLYQLTLEPQTVFAKYPPQLPAEQAIADMESVIDASVVGSGWARYEVSAYARDGKVCRHNMNYWTFGDYLGVGPGAHSKLSFPDQILRQARIRNPQQWIRLAKERSGAHVAEQRVLENSDLPFEFMLNALRLKEGVALSLFQERTGLPVEVLRKTVAQAINRGLLEPNPTQLRATALGWSHLNDLQALFLE